MQVRVVNKNEYPYVENFKGEVIRIPAGGYIVMDKNKAEIFTGTFSPAKKTPMGQPDPATFKRLDIEPHNVMVDELIAKEPTKWVSNADGKEFSTEAEMKAWELENHVDKIADAKVQEEMRKKKTK